MIGFIQLLYYIFLYRSNFIRFSRIVFDNISEVLRFLFQTTMSNKYPEQWSNNEGREFILKNVKARLFQDQKELLIEGNIKKWDISLMVQMLLYSDLFLYVDKIGTVSINLESDGKKVKELACASPIDQWNMGDIMLIDIPNSQILKEQF